MRGGGSARSRDLDAELELYLATEPISSKSRGRTEGVGLSEIRSTNDLGFSLDDDMYASVPSTKSRVYGGHAPRSQTSGAGLARSARYGSVPPRFSSEREDDDIEHITVTPHYPSSYDGLRSKTVDAKDKMGRHKTMMDKYLPVYMGVENQVQYEIDNKYGELVARMPSLDPHRSVKAYSPPTEQSYGSQRTVLPPPAAAQQYYYNKNVGVASLRPPVSETRRRVRAVVCKARGDRRYYDN